MKTKLLSLAIAASIAPVSYSAFGQHTEQHNEEITVTSLPLAPTTTDSTRSVEVITDEELRASISSSIGESLKNIPGVIGASFGSGASAPVIRGQSGSRVRVLQDGIGLSDAASVSPDHANAVEPALATRIEIIRGPATLLYGNGAVGGIVNVIDKRIPSELEDELLLEQRFDTNNEGSTTVISADKQLGSFVAHFDASFTSADDISIPGRASLEEEEEHDEHEEEEHEDEHDEESNGVLENSDIENSQFSIGGSFVSESGFIGASVTVQEKDYGLPEGAHAHEEEEEHDEDEEMHDEEEHEEEEEIVRIELESLRFAVKANYKFDSFWKELDAQVSVTDYEHQEFENGEPGTLFENDSVEFRGLLKHAHGDAYSGVIGTQIVSSEFSALGDEAFIPKTENSSFALFTVQSYDAGDMLYEAGLRIEQQDYSTPQCNRDFVTYSASASSLWRANGSNNIVATFTHSERAPTTEELFSNVSESTCATETDEALWVEHLATGRIELGNPDLDTETSNNIELAWRKFEGPFQFEIGTYYNQIDSYTYLSDRHEDEEEHEEGEEEHDEEEHEHEGEIVADYLQEDARFVGVELKALTTMELDTLGHIDFELFADSTRAMLDNGDRLPRIPAARAGASIGFNTERYGIKLNATHSFQQDDVAEEERVSDSYTDVSIYADYHANLGSGEWVVFAKGENLLDEEIRNHASFTKDFAPEKGIGFTLGLRLQF